MKKIFFILLFVSLVSSCFAQKWEYLQISAIESVVPGGLGRSRLITTDKNNQMVEVNLENFFSMVGINFKNIRNNDQVIVGKLNELADQGWELFQVVSGVESSEKNTGIFITRYIFRREKK
jgi:hypothetical protein